MYNTMIVMLGGYQNTHLNGERLLCVNHYRVIDISGSPTPKVDLKSATTLTLNDTIFSLTAGLQ